ncbi:MAG TPA: hypothetical protein V6C81_27715 [Planktothrix sp.]|jgi:hypothetical protein
MAGDTQAATLTDNLVKEAKDAQRTGNFETLYQDLKTSDPKLVKQEIASANKQLESQGLLPIAEFDDHSLTFGKDGTTMHAEFDAPGNESSLTMAKNSSSRTIHLDTSTGQKTSEDDVLGRSANAADNPTTHIEFDKQGRETSRIDHDPALGDETTLTNPETGKITSLDQTKWNALDRKDATEITHIHREFDESGQTSHIKEVFGPDERPISHQEFDPKTDVELKKAG